MRQKLSIDFRDEAETASRYHTGQHSMLYAVASTGYLRAGSLSKGTIEEFRNLVEQLQSEASDAADNAEEDNDGDCYDLREIETKCQNWLDTNSED